ncbi:hypothetical protein JDS99_29095 [Bacillus cereus group sp. N6]|nr:hypothetical protein [Bacillus cereus group sp. N6]
MYDIASVHDFLVTENTPTDLKTYKEFKLKLNRRIQRFLNKIETCNKILFVRIGGTYEEAKQLEFVLSKIVQVEFEILLINEIEENQIIEYDWDFPYTCSIGMPLMENGLPSTTNGEMWNYLFKGIRYSEIQSKG